MDPQSMHEAVLTWTHNLCFEQNKKNIKIFQLKIAIFTAVKICSILHRHVYVMFEFIPVLLEYSDKIWSKPLPII